MNFEGTPVAVISNHIPLQVRTISGHCKAGMKMLELFVRLVARANKLAIMNPDVTLGLSNRVDGIRSRCDRRHD
jgi:hypothetical protein